MRKEDAAPSYAAAQPIEIIWNFQKLPNINLAAAVRESRFSEHSPGNKKVQPITMCWSSKIRAIGICCRLSLR